MTDDEIIALKYQHGIEASVPPGVTRSALKQFLDCAEASHIESDMNIMAVRTPTGYSFVIYNRTSDLPCPYAEEVLCKCVIVQHHCGGLCTVRFTNNKGIFTVGVVHKDDDEIKRFTKCATEWYKKPSHIIPANPEPIPRRAPETFQTHSVKPDNKNILDDAVKRMKEIAKDADCDTETAHCRGDALLCETLDKLGFSELARIFNAMEKWYA